MEVLNTTVQDAKTLLKAARKHKAGDDADGISAALIDLLAGAVERALAADTTQRDAYKTVGRQTETQDKAVSKARILIRKERDAAKGCYGSGDKQMMKAFGVGNPQAKTVKDLITDLAFMKKAGAKYIGDLSGYGFKAADLAALTAAASDLEAADALQELAKKAQKTATGARNQAVKDLKTAMQKVRSTAKSVFYDQKGVLADFETIKRAKARKQAATATEA